MPKIGTLYKISLLFVLISAQVAVAQKKAKNKNFVFVSNDYRQPKSGLVLVKFFSEELKYSQGYNIYRKKEGTNDLVRINRSPVLFVSSLPRGIRLEGENYELWQKLNTTQPSTINANGMAKAIIKLRAALSFDFAVVIGQAFIDTSAVKGETYQYVVRKIDKVTDFMVATSLSIKVGDWDKDKEPQDIKMDKKKTGVQMSWLPEPAKHMGVNVYRKAKGGKEYVKVTESPVAPRLRENGKYPAFFYTDIKTSNDTVYLYKLAAVDYFGQSSEFSQEFTVGKKDFEPPLPPDSVQLDVDTFSIKLKWKAPVSPDLAGFNVYRSMEYAANFQKVNTKPIPKSSLKYTDKVPGVNEYFYQVTAVDSSGNEGVSMVTMADVRDVVAPETPKNLKATIENGKIILTWSPSPDKDLKGYFVYKSPAGGTDFVILNGKPFKEPMFEIPYSKKSKTKFTYQVLAIDSSFNRSVPTPPMIVQLPDVMAPGQPFIKSIDLKDGFPTILWMPNVDNDLKNYSLIRMKYGKDTVKTLVKQDISKNDTLFTDKTAEQNESYKYTLFATDSTGNISLGSTPYSFKNVNTNTVLKVKKFAAKFDKKTKAVNITWTLETDKNYYGLVIFRAYGDEDMLQYSKKLVTELDFIDKSVQKPGIYHYQMRIYDKVGNVVRSEVVDVVISDVK